MSDRFAVEDLLAPLAAADGAGPDVRGGGSGGSALYLAIKDARTDARLAERNAIASGDAEIDPLMAGLRGWETVRDGATRLFAETKDLQVAAWLTEAWLRTDGFPGVAAGFALMAGLIERYWDDGLHPQEDEDGVETRVAPLFGLFGNSDVGTLLQPLKLLPLSDHA
ncbi:MAG: type VI secretion system ImpA family N-terminal domain-containing protein, partial [Sphingomonas sp.]